VPVPVEALGNVVGDPLGAAAASALAACTGSGVCGPAPQAATEAVTSAIAPAIVS
jgi:hypothetical protein